MIVFRRIQIWKWCTVAAALVAAMWATSTSAHGATHVVRAGETVKSIAAAHGTTAAAIVRANAIVNADLLQVGQRLNVPQRGARPVVVARQTTGDSVIVRRGDTLGAIAMRTGTTAGAIAQANGIVNPNAIRVGTRLRIPSGGAPAPSVPRGTVATPSQGGVHVVRAGDTLTTIARRSGVTVAQIATANGMRTTDLLTIGRRLVVPGANASTPSTSAPAAPVNGGIYVVRAGDTLGVIAARLGVSADALAAANGLRNANVIAIGQRLRVPSGGGQASPVPVRATTRPVSASTVGSDQNLGKGSIRTLIGQSAARYGVDPALVRAIAWQESGWWQGARSSAGALGVMQLMPDTATWVGPALVGRRIDATNARDNIDGGTAYVAWLLRNTTSRDQAVASYYQGLGSVQRRGMYDDTRQYVRSVNSHYGRR